MIIKYSEADIDSLNFCYMVQMDNHRHEENIFDCQNPEFWIEKRLSFVVCPPSTGSKDGHCGMFGFFYSYIHEKDQKLITRAKLVERLNGATDTENGRYYRKLNNKELSFLISWIAKRSA